MPRMAGGSSSSLQAVPRSSSSAFRRKNRETGSAGGDRALPLTAVVTSCWAAEPGGRM